MTFERPSAGLSNPDAADNLPASLNLALCSRKSGSDEARQGQSRNAVSGDGCVGSTERNASKQKECPALFRAEVTFSRATWHLWQLDEPIRQVWSGGVQWHGVGRMGATLMARGSILRVPLERHCAKHG